MERTEGGSNYVKLPKTSLLYVFSVQGKLTTRRADRARAADLRSLQHREGAQQRHGPGFAYLLCSHTHTHTYIYIYIYVYLFVVLLFCACGFTLL